MRAEVLHRPLRADRHLLEAWVRAGLARFAASCLAEPDPLFAELPRRQAARPQLAGLDWEALEAARPGHANGWQGPLGRLATLLSLTPRDLFLLGLCGAVEEDHWIGLAIDTLQAPPRGTRPALHLLDALSRSLFQTPLSPVQWRAHPLLARGVLTLDDEDTPLPARTLRMSPELWALLAGDEDFTWPGVEALSTPPETWLAPALRERLPRLTDLLERGEAGTLLLRGGQAHGLAVAAHLARGLGRAARRVPWAEWQFSAALRTAAACARWLPVLCAPSTSGESLRLPATGDVPVVVVTGPTGQPGGDDWLSLTLPIPGAGDRHRLWRATLGPVQAWKALADSARLDGPTIHALAHQARLAALRDGTEPGPLHVAQARLARATPALRPLARPVRQAVPREALVLPGSVANAFETLVARCRRRDDLWQGLGPSIAARAGPGLCALFSGESGTGKTLAASHLATRLGAPLFRLDLASVLNKYVGETEKALGRVLDAAAEHDVILLLDEADALFARRTGGEGPGERFANMLTNFLLTRIERHAGILVLTTNARGSIDPAFLRRLDMVLEFPRPGPAERLALWHSHLGARAPQAALCHQLANWCELSGGHIRNAVLAAAALHPGRDPLPVAALVAALRAEYRKLGQAMPGALEALAGGCHD